MAKLKSIEAGHFRIPLEVPASDDPRRDGVVRTHHLRVTDAEGQEGVGYTYTIGHNGGAMHHVLAREIPRSWPAPTAS